MHTSVASQVTSVLYKNKSYITGHNAFHAWSQNVADTKLL